MVFFPFCLVIIKMSKLSLVSHCFEINLEMYKLVMKHEKLLNLDDVSLLTEFVVNGYLREMSTKWNIIMPNTIFHRISQYFNESISLKEPLLAKLI